MEFDIAGMKTRTGKRLSHVFVLIFLIKGIFQPEFFINIYSLPSSKLVGYSMKHFHCPYNELIGSSVVLDLKMSLCVPQKSPVLEQHDIRG